VKQQSEWQIEWNITGSAPNKTGMGAHGSEWIETDEACGNKFFLDCSK
jgi:hypothetical protein